MDTNSGLLKRTAKDTHFWADNGIVKYDDVTLSKVKPNRESINKLLLLLRWEITRGRIT